LPLPGTSREWRRRPFSRHIQPMTSKSTSPREPSEDSPLTAAQMQALADGMERAGKILRAGRMAALTGWSVIAFGAISILASLLSPKGVLVGGALLWVGWNELEGRRTLLRFDPGGARRLARNQLWLLAVVLLYCGWAIYRSRSRPIPEVTELESLMGLGEGFVADATAAVYALIMALATVFQWGMYRFHLARVALVEAYLRITPSWVVEVQRTLRPG